MYDSSQVGPMHFNSSGASRGLNSSIGSCKRIVNLQQVSDFGKYPCAEIETADMDVSMEAFLRVHAECEEADGRQATIEEGALSHSYVKQYYAALRWLQELQHTLCYGEMVSPDITSMRSIKNDLRQRKQHENSRKARQHIDAAYGKQSNNILSPLLIET